MKLYSHFTQCKKINSKWIKVINVRPGTIKLLEKKYRAKSTLHWFGQYFFGYDSKNTGKKRQIENRVTSK
jgi:hypothetical protein